jgi:hypothetical protein
MRKKCFYLFLAVTAFVFCTPRTGLKDVTAKEKSPRDSTRQQSIKADKAPETNVKLTFIDTLNQGREISLVQPSVQKTSYNEASSHFSIQVVASSLIEAVRSKKKELERNTKLNLNIVFESPFYKLYAGDFDKRTDAESELVKIKNLGYPDAWVVTTSK